MYPQSFHKICSSSSRSLKRIASLRELRTRKYTWGYTFCPFAPRPFCLYTLPAPSPRSGSPIRRGRVGEEPWGFIYRIGREEYSVFLSVPGLCTSLDGLQWVGPSPSGSYGLFRRTERQDPRRSSVEGGGSTGLGPYETLGLPGRSTSPSRNSRFHDLPTKSLTVGVDRRGWNGPLSSLYV